MAAVERTAGAIRGRSDRICNVVASEMDNYEPGLYTERVLEAVRLLSTGMMPNFAQKIDGVVDLLGRGKEDEIDDNEFIEATRLVYDGVREIRRVGMGWRAAMGHLIWDTWRDSSKLSKYKGHS